MKILIINHHAGSNRHGMVYRPFYLAREWVRLGHQVTIVASSVSHLRIQEPRIEGSASEEEIDGVRYLWVRTPPHRRSGVRRVISMLAFVGQLLRYERRLIERYRPSVVIASSSYHLDAIPARRIATRSPATLISEVRDLWPLTPVELGGMAPWHPFVAMLQRAENFAYRSADRVVSALPNAESYLSAHGMASHKFAYVPNGVDVSEWQTSREPVPTGHREALEKLRKEGLFIVGYTGGHGLAHALNDLVDAAQQMRSQPAAFVLVGQGPEKQALQEKATRLRLARVVFLTPVPRLSVPALLASMDALYIGWKKKPLYQFGISPNKLLDYMMAGKPVVHAVDAANDLVAESRCGISVPPESPAAVAEAITRLMEMSATERAALGLRGKAYVSANFDYHLLAQQYLGVIQ
jgi:glycosyltransferase involved in cell wall biosynthesis